MGLRGKEQKAAKRKIVSITLGEDGIGLARGRERHSLSLQISEGGEWRCLKQCRLGLNIKRVEARLKVPKASG